MTLSILGTQAALVLLVVTVEAVWFRGDVKGTKNRDMRRRIVVMVHGVSAVVAGAFIVASGVVHDLPAMIASVLAFGLSATMTEGAWKRL